VVLRRSLALLVATAMMMVMMAVSSAFAQPGGSENSCGASNPEFGKPPSKGRTLGKCGIENNPLFPDKPESPHFG
jgi:hypothetical protein